MNGYISIYLLINASLCIMFVRGVKEPWKEQEDVISYDSMPDLFLLDNYDRCLSSPGGTFCLLDIELARVPGRLHDYIADYSSDIRRHFNHSRQHRGVCVSERCRRLNSSTLDDTELLACINSTNLQISKVRIRYCNTADQNFASPDVLDYSVAAIVLALVLLAICGTVHDIMHQAGKCKENRYAMVFSVAKNWSELCDKPGSCSNNTNTFQFLQGMRFLTMFVIIGIHAGMGSVLSFSINPQFFETIYDVPRKNWLPNTRVVLQTFFAMGGFLLTHQILKDDQKIPFGLRRLPGAIFKRYIRFIPTMMVVAGLSATWLPRMGSGPLWDELVKQNVCRHHWWKNLLFIQNFYAFGETCIPQSWYLAADMQLHLLGLLLMVAVCRFRQHGWLLFSAALVTSLLVSGLDTYFLHLAPIRVIFSPEKMYNVMWNDATHLRGYMSAQSNWTGYTLGMITAYVHHQAQRNHWIMDKYVVLKGLYYLSLPLALVAVWIGAELHTRPASTLEAVLFNTLDQNMFAAAMCIFMIGCIYKCDRVLRACVEWGPWQPLGKLSFCALLIHIIILGMYMGHMSNLFYVSEYSMLFLVVATTTVSYILSVPLYLLVEQPSYRLHRILTSVDGDKLSTCDSTKETMHKLKEL